MTDTGQFVRVRIAGPWTVETVLNRDDGADATIVARYGPDGDGGIALYWSDPDDLSEAETDVLLGRIEEIS